MSREEQLNRLFGDSIDEAAGKRANTPKLVPIRRTPDAEPAEAREGDIRHIPTAQIVIREQHRKHFSKPALQELADSIASLGVIEPIIVRPDTEHQLFELVAGERRYRAAMMIGLDSVPSRIMKLTDADVAEVQLAENLVREDLNPIEQARAFRDVMAKTGRNAAQLAKRIGINRATVTRALALLRLPDDVQEQVATGKTSAGVAREIARIRDEPTQRKVLNQVEMQSLTAEQTEHRVQAIVGLKKTNRKTQPRRYTFDTEANGTIVWLPPPATNVTYDHAAAALEEASAEVKHRIKNRVSLG